MQYGKGHDQERLAGHQYDGPLGKEAELELDLFSVKSKFVNIIKLGHGRTPSVL
jgi:hypothetical protein